MGRTQATAEDKARRARLAKGRTLKDNRDGMSRQYTSEDGYRLRIEYDPDAQNPREDFDCLGTIFVPRSNRYLSSDSKCEFAKLETENFLARIGALEPAQVDDLGEELDIDGPYFFAPVGAHIHSGITVWLGSMGNTRTKGQCQWDSGTIGTIYCTVKRAREEYGEKLTDAELEEKVRACFESEIQTLDTYLTGDVYGYRVYAPSEDFDGEDFDEDEDGEELEACWGFFGSEWAEEEAWAAFDSIMERERDAAMDYACRC